MAANFFLGVSDYLVILVTLLVSAYIGIKFRPSSKRVQTAAEYLLAGRDMPRVPVILSISVTLLSAITLIGSPAEVYRFGPKNIVKLLVLPVGMALASFVFIPVYFQCGVCTVYEYLELRFGKATRYSMSLLFTFQMVLYMSSALYAPVLALNAVTGLPVRSSIVAFGSICAIYCAIGGLKGVLWTDVFQCCLICCTVVAFYVSAVPEAGGLSTLYERASEGGRLQIFDFTFDLSTRYTFWNGIMAMLIHGFSSYGVNQVEVQRLLSMRSEKRARSTLLISTIPLTTLYLLCNIFGIVLYAIYYACDPVLNKEKTGVTKYDQLVPYYFISKFHAIPGLTGLCVAGIFSGALSTVSSVLNSVATVSVVDFIRPLFPSALLTEERSVSLAKILSLFYGFLGIFLALSLMTATSIREVSALMVGCIEGPAAAIFSVGVLTRKGSSKSVSFSLLAGVAMTAWIAYGIFSNPVPPTPLPLGTCEEVPATDNPSHSLYTGCSLMENGSLAADGHLPNSTFDGPLHDCPPAGNATSRPLDANSDTFFLFKLSFNWVNSVGFFGTLIITYIVNIITGGWDNPTHPINPLYLSPVTRFWLRPLPPVSKELRDGTTDDPSPPLLSHSGGEELLDGPKLVAARRPKKSTRFVGLRTFLQKLKKLEPRGELARVPEFDEKTMTNFNRNSRMSESEA